MKRQQRFLAFDLGAESGRAMLGELEGQRLSVREVSRFPNRMLELNGHLFWDVWHLLNEVKNGMRACAAEEPTSIGIDTWGVDFGLLASDGTLLGLPYSYRDDRAAGLMSRFHRQVSMRRVYELTGVQFLSINTLYQLYAMRLDRSLLLRPPSFRASRGISRRDPSTALRVTGVQGPSTALRVTRAPDPSISSRCATPSAPLRAGSGTSRATRGSAPLSLLDVATDLLFMPDLFVYLLTGRKNTEFTIATTSQLYSPVKRRWAAELLKILGLPKRIMQDIVQPGTEIGPLSPSVAAEVGLKGTRVVATASHDTAAAVAAVPAEGDDWMFISAGTWSLVGVEVEKPIITTAALRHNFTNEGGVGGRFRFLKNVTGFWLMRQLVEAWGGAVDYGTLVKEAAAARPFGALIDPDASCFRVPGGMGPALVDYCRKTRQPAPSKRAQQVRAVLESLALKYRLVRDELERVTGRRIGRVHVVGGGAHNWLLCQMTADALGLPVYAGPAEATAIGNIMVQAMAAGLVSSLEETRAVVWQSCRVRRYQPRPSREWDSAYERFSSLQGIHPHPSLPLKGEGTKGRGYDGKSVGEE